MSNKKTLDARGLYTDPNLLSKVPEGALVQADNVIIDRDGIVEPRRGFGKFAEDFGVPDDTAKQMLSYKNRLLVHYDNKLMFNANPHLPDVDGNFETFDGDYLETSPGLRIKGIESNRNFYFTTSDGIKKISATTAEDLSTDPGYIIDAGGVKALDVTGKISGSGEGFLPADSAVGYRVVWGYKDANDNLILGSPSSRLVVKNYSEYSTDVDLEFVIPNSVEDYHFYQVYRTGIFTATSAIDLASIDPGDEMNLVIEDFPTATELSNRLVMVQDISADTFRAGGTPLYTNPNSGEGIDQANEPPPKSKDITTYQSTTFYANIESRARKTLDLLSVSRLVSGTSKVFIESDAGTEEYTFVGAKETTEVDFSSYIGSLDPAVLDGDHFNINSASNSRKYYVWYDNTQTTQNLDFNNYVKTIPSDLDGLICVVYTNSDRVYYVWFDATGSTIDPGLTNPVLADMLSIKVDITAVTDEITLTAAMKTQIDAQASTDFSTVDNSGDIDLITDAFDSSGISPVENINFGFVYDIDTPPNNDPDTTDRFPIRIATGSFGGVITQAQLADITAAGILEQDAVPDFDVSYTPGAESFELQTTNNGNINDPSQTGLTATAGSPTVVTASNFNISDQDTITISNSTTTPSIDGQHIATVIDSTSFSIPILTTVGGTCDYSADSIGDGFAITVTIQGDGEDASLNHILLSDSPSPAIQIDETARSMVNVINKNTDEVVNAFYLSGPTDIPGQMLLEVRDVSTTSFSVYANDSATGESFNPTLPSGPGDTEFVGTSETKANRVMFSKLQQPEAVPLVNFIDVGPQDKGISRILALRESLFLLKEDGIYRLTGIDGNFTVDLFDESTKIIAPDTAIVLNNQIYCLTNQGVAQISDTGVQIVSKQLDNVIQTLTSSNYEFENSSFGVSYETDRAFLLFMPSTVNDTVATQAYRFNTFTDSWTRFPISKTCGLVNPSDDKLYLGPADENFIEQERKNFSRTDYADRKFNLFIPPNSVDGKDVSLSQSNITSDGDAIVQTQYLTLSKYNQILKKLDIDPSTGSPEVTLYDFSSYSGTIPGDLHSKYYFSYSAADATKFVTFYDAIGNLTSLDVNSYPDIAGASQIRVDISTGTTNTIDVAQKTAIAIGSTNNDFTVNYAANDSFFSTRTVLNGETTDSSDSVVNGVGDGYAISTTTQGFGDYFSLLEGVPGDNLKIKISELAIKLDNDPSVGDTDYFSSIQDYTGSGTSAIGNPTVITSVGHQLQTGRMVTVANGTVIPDGNYIITKVSDDEFSIDYETASVDAVDWVALMVTFEEIQGGFNTLVHKINDDAGILQSNYPLSVGTVELEDIIITSTVNSNTIILQFNLPLVEGPVDIYEGISAEFMYGPDSFGDPSVMKHVREGTVMFENNNFTRAVVGYKTDLSPGLELIEFTKSGKGDWSQFIWSNQNWGGGFASIPLRTYIPRQKQRCRYIQVQFVHISAREKWAVVGISYTLRGISERGYKGN